jgi:hypothetical protein
LYTDARGLAPEGSYRLGCLSGTIRGVPGARGAIRARSPIVAALAESSFELFGALSNFSASPNWGCALVALPSLPHLGQRWLFFQPDRLQITPIIFKTTPRSFLEELQNSRPTVARGHLVESGSRSGRPFTLSWHGIATREHRSGPYRTGAAAPESTEEERQRGGLPPWWKSRAASNA